MPTKKKNKGSKQKKKPIENKKRKKKNIGVSRKTVKKSKIQKKVKEFTSLEKQEIWKKNYILAAIVIILMILNVWFYYSKGRGTKILQNKPPSQNTGGISSNRQEKVSNTNVPETEEEETNDKVIQSLLAEKETENWKTYQNKVYGFEIKYPQDWPDPAVSGFQEGFKYRYKVTFREKNSDSGEPANGLDIYIYRTSQPSNKLLKADYTDNLVVKDTAARDYSNCNSLEIFSIGAEEYPAVQVYTKSDDPCFREAYFLSLRKGFYIYDIVPFLKSGINYEGYDGEAKVKEEFSDFYKVVATLNFPIVEKTVTTPTANRADNPIVKPKVEAPRVSRGIRCPEKIQHPHKSVTKGKHTDEDCCPDPDEYPKAGCAYSAHDFSIMLKR